MNKLLQKMVICFLGLGCTFCYGKTQQTNTFNVSISKNVPPTLLLAHVPVTLEKTREPHNLDSGVRDAEIAYTWYWIDKVFSKRSPVTKGINRKEAECLTNVGSRGDDAVVVSWQANGFDMTVIDSRLLMLVIRKQGWIKDSTLDVFLEFVNARVHCLEVKDPINSELIGKEGDQASWGKLHIIQAGWFHVPIEWYRTKDTMIFVFDKSLSRVSRKGDYTIKDATGLFGGARIDDATPYLRFEKSNRQEHAEKQFRLLPVPTPVKRDYDGLCSPAVPQDPIPDSRPYQ